jgi:hypothetical protein
MKLRTFSFLLPFAVYIVFITTPLMSLEDAGLNKGPLFSNNLYPFYLPFINLFPEGARTLGEGNNRMILHDNYANTFNLDLDGLGDGFQLDMDVENTRLTLSYDYGFTDRIDLGIDLPYLVQYGGVFDRLIEWYHLLFGFPNAGRGYVDRNLYHLRVINENGTWIDMEDPSHGFGDVTIRSKISLLSLPQHGFHAAIQPALKIPTGKEDALFSSGRPDWALNLLLEKSWERVALYWNSGWMHVEQPEGLDVFPFRQDLFSYMGSVEWIAGPRWSFFLQADGNTTPYKNGHRRMDKHTGAFHIGFKHVVSSGWVLQVNFEEEFLSFDEEVFTFAAVDIGLLIALIHVF